MKWIVRHPRVFFVSLSIFLWAAGRLSSDDVQLHLDYKLRYSGFVASPQAYLPQEVDLQIKANGYALLSEWLNPVRSIAVSKSALDQLKPQWQGGLQLIDLKPLITSSLNDEFNLISIEDEERRFQIPDFVEEYWSVPVGIPEGLQREGFSIKLIGMPDSIRVIGLKDELDEFRKEGVEIEFDQSFPGSGWHMVTLSARLPVNSRLIAEPIQMEIEALIQQSSTIYKEVKIELANDKRNVTLVPSSVQMAFNVPLSDFAKWESQEVVATVDLANAEDEVLQVSLDMPEELRSLLLYSTPNFVRVITERQ